MTSNQCHPGNGIERKWMRIMRMTMSQYLPRVSHSYCFLLSKLCVEGGFMISGGNEAEGLLA